jgi:hypothetical protein
MWRCVGLWWFSLATTGCLFGQAAALSGLVKDPSGAAIQNAELTFLDQSNGGRYQQTTDKAGFYGFAAMKPGVYEATVQADKFRMLTQEGIILNVAERASLDFILLLPIKTESITVNSQSALINSTDPAVSTVVDQQFVQNMPLNGRTFQSLIDLTPGMVLASNTFSVGGAGVGQFSVNGQRATANYFMVDGVSATFGIIQSVGLGQTWGGAIPGFNSFGATNGLVSVDAMQEFRVLSSSFAPEYGRSPGSQILILTRSGANQFHGNAFDYLRNDIFDARNFFDVPPMPKPPLHQNDFGGTLGGAIRKNRTFFFFSYEGLRLLLPETATSNFFTAAARQNVAPAFKPLEAALPIPDGPVNSDGITASLTAVYSAPSTLNATSLRIDQNISDNITLFGRYNHAPSASSSRYWSAVSKTSVNTDTATLGLTILVTPTKLNEFRANWSRQSAGNSSHMTAFYGAVPPPDSALFPPAYNNGDKFQFLPGSGSDGKVIVGNPPPNVQTQWNLVDTISLTAGAHALKFGLDWRGLNITQGNSNEFLMIANYPAAQAGIADYIAQIGDESVSARTENFSWFAQDMWKVLPSLTLTYGLRWDIVTAPVATIPGRPLFAFNGIFDSQPFGLAPAGTPLWRTRFNNFAPRIGAAWQITPTTVLRGGYGLFYDLGYGGGVSEVMSNFPYGNETTLGLVPFYLNNPAFVPPSPVSFAVTPNLATIYAVDPHLRLPLTYEWNVTVERAFGPNQRLWASYVGAHGQNLLREDSIQLTPAGNPTVFATANGDWSHYSALQVQFQRRMTRGLQVLASYTLAKSTDTNSTDVCQCSYTNMLSSVNPGADLGPSAFDQRNAFAAAASYHVPAPSRGLGHLLLGNWTLDAIIHSSSALPFTVFTSNDSPVFGSYYTRPDIVPGVPFYLPDANNPGGRILNAAAFAAPPPGQYGDLPRNAFRGFPINQTDLALSRQLHFSERVSLNVRAEYFNVFNHPMFFFPNNYWEPPYRRDFGMVTTTLNEGLSGGDEYGFSPGALNPLYQSGGPRSAQLTLRLVF